MKVRLPYIVEDQYTAFGKGMDPVAFYEYDGADLFLNGPVSNRIAVVDCDADSGALRPGAAFLPPDGEDGVATYAIDGRDTRLRARLGGDLLRSRDFNSVSVFTTVLRTLDMFERNEVMGRTLGWGFGGPQLLVVPRAGRLTNAYYERESRSLQFFYFRSGKSGVRDVYTSLSHDIVAHETAHAILDGIDPDLYDAITPQSLALHEAVADITTMVMGIDTDVLRHTVLRQTEGRLNGHTAFSDVAREFGAALNGEPFLRSMENEKNLDPKSKQCVDRYEPHDLSQVLTGALFRVLTRAFEKEKGWLSRRQRGRRAIRGKRTVASAALRYATGRLRRLIYRALDYLPPGDVSFADYGRAVVASDQASYPDRGDEREWLKEEFVRRSIVRRTSDLDVETNVTHAGAAALDLDRLIESDYYAYEFANGNRSLLGIPDGVPFEVRPRLRLTKETPHELRKRRLTTECILKASWVRPEEGGLDSRYPRRRAVTVGTTLAIDWNTRLVRARLTTDRSGRLRTDRTRFLRRLDSEDLLDPGDAPGVPGASDSPHARIERGGGAFRVRGAGRTLHLSERGGAG